MARLLRIEFPGALYHVISSGNGRADIYLGAEDRQAFLDVLGEVCRRMQRVCYAYCLMTNHYHLVVETPLGHLSKDMRQVNGVHTQLFKRCRGGEVDSKGCWRWERHRPCEENVRPDRSGQEAHDCHRSVRCETWGSASEHGEHFSKV